MNIYSFVATFFRVVCALTTLILGALCFFKFIWDEDVSQIFFQEYHKLSHSIYPTLTLCLLNENIFSEEKLRSLNISKGAYSSFLRGEYWNDEMSKIDFEDVTVQLEDYIEGISISSAKNQTVYYHCSNNFQRILLGLLGYQCQKEGNLNLLSTSFQNHESKCLSVGIPFDKNNVVLKLRVLIKTSIFPQNVLKEFETRENFGIFLHYKQQLFRSPVSKLYRKAQNGSALNAINFKINNMEVFRRRNKHKRPCNENWNDDENILERIVGNIGCKPPHWKVTKELRKCMNRSSVRSYNLPLIYWIPRIPYLNFLNDLPPPCSTILGVNYEYSETKWKLEEFQHLNADLNFFEVNLEFPNPTYKEITQVKAYDEESFVGNVGGYIGMFLGISILQIPEYVNMVYKKSRDAKGAVSKTIRSNLETGIRLVAGDIQVEEGNNLQTLPNDSSMESFMVREQAHIQALSKKLRLLEEKVETLIDENSQFPNFDTLTGQPTETLRNEILV